MNTVKIPTTHEIEIYYNISESFRKDRLESVLKMACANLCANEVININAVEDHKGELTVYLRELDPMENTDYQFKNAWNIHNEIHVKIVVGEKLPF